MNTLAHVGILLKEEPLWSDDNATFLSDVLTRALLTIRKMLSTDEAQEWSRNYGQNPNSRRQALCLNGQDSMSGIRRHSTKPLRMLWPTQWGPFATRWVKMGGQNGSDHVLLDDSQELDKRREHMQDSMLGLDAVLSINRISQRSQIRQRLQTLLTWQLIDSM